MEIQYKKNNGGAWGNSEYTDLDPVTYWVVNNINSGGIESKIEKLVDLISILAEKHLEKYPEDVVDVAYAIGCYGIDHKVVEEKDEL